jgi:MFS family permease
VSAQLESRPFEPRHRRSAVADSSQCGCKLGSDNVDFVSQPVPTRWIRRCSRTGHVCLRSQLAFRKFVKQFTKPGTGLEQGQRLSLGPVTAAPRDTTVPRHAWLALSVATLVTFLVVIDISAVNVAFPTMTEDLDTTRAGLSWVVSGYNITVGALLLAAGRVADSIGRRRVFLPGVAIVSAASMAVVLPDFPPARRSGAIGIMGATGALGAVTGPVVGSFLIDVFSWRAIFLINVPVCVVILIAGARLLRESSDPDATGRIDFIGAAVGTASVGLVMFGIVNSEQWGLSDLQVWLLVAAGVVFFPVLLERSRTHTEPLINLELFQHRSFASVNFSVVFYGLAFTAGALVSSLALQDMWELSIRSTGLALAPGPLVAAVASPVSGSIADRFGHRWVLGLGSGCLALSCGLLVLLLSETPEVRSRFVPISLLLGVGIGLTVGTWTSAGLSDVPHAKFGVAGATFNTIRQMTYALGISIAIILVSAGESPLDISGYRWAWGFICLSYVACAVAVVTTFPSGTAAERNRIE